MESDNALVLSPLGIYRGNSGNGHQYYQMMLKDSTGTVYVASFGCKLNFTESIEKAFSRLTMIPAPEIADVVEIEQEEAEQSEATQ